MGNYQKYRGNPEQKLFFLLNNFMGGINTEFSDDSSNDVDFDSIINFDMDKLGTLNKRGGFGELTAISEIFNKLDVDTQLPNIKNRTETNPNPENENDNVVYMKLLKNDNNCFRALSGFSGTNAYRKYQEMYGFQNNKFILLLITTKFAEEDGETDTSTAWLYQCTLPELEYEGGEPTSTDTMTITCNKITLPVVFNWDRNLMNIDTIEYYDKIYFTGNEKGIVTFDRSIDIEDDEDLASAFTYSGSNFTDTLSYTCTGTETGDYYFVYNTVNYQFTMPTITSGDILYFNTETLKLYFNDTEVSTISDNTGTLITMNSIQNNAYLPSGLEVRHVGFNVLQADPMHSIDTQGVTTDSIQGIFICTSNNVPLQNLPLGQKFLLNIIYTGTDNGFTIEMKDGENTISFDKLENSTLSTVGLKVYDITLKDPPSGEVEIKITKNDATLEPYYDYYSVAQVDAEAKAVEALNVGDYGICEMYNRAVFYKDDTIWFSEVNNFKYIPNYNYVTLPIEPTDKITKIAYFKKSYIVFTKERIYKMTGSFGTNDFAVSPVNMSLGCHAGNTVVPIEDTLYFSSPRGLYALKSNTFIEGYENVRELDLKVKKLTSDFTKYDEELTNPAVRFNGVSERAYALRYKDKYLLFYNNAYDKGDYAAINDLDTLAYQFDIQAYTTYRFKEKPTFLFMVDNAIETLATVAQDQIFTDETVVFDYDLTQVNGNIVEDQSESGNDAIIRGDMGLNQGIGVNLDGVDSYIKLNNFNGNIENGFNLLLETKFTSLNGATLVDFQQGTKTATSIEGNITTNASNGYSARLDYTITPNAATGNDTVSYRLYYMREEGTAETGQLTYNITGLVEDKTIEFDLTGVTSKLVDSGTFSISRDRNFNYSATWVLNISSTYITVVTETTQVLGADVNLTNKFYDTSKSWIKLGFTSFKAVATETGCKITYTSAVKNTASLTVGSRDLHVYIDGTKYTNTVGSISSTGTHKATSARTINLTYTGSKRITVSLTYNIKATLSGTYTANVSTSGSQSITLPSVTTTTTETTVTTPFSINGSKAISLTRAIESFREIILKQNGSADQLLFKISTEFGEYSLLTPTNIGLTTRHIWRVDIGEGDTNYICSIYRDGEVLVSQQIPSNMLINSFRNECYIGTDINKSLFMSGDLYSVEINNPDGLIMGYTFSEGTGTTITDISSNRVIGTLNGGITWLTAEGLVFNGVNSYLQLPELDNIFFSNGFKIEFSGIIGTNDKIARIIDLATSYNNDTSRNKKCSINIGVKDNLISFNTTSTDYISYRVTDNTIDFSEPHDYVIDCVNNGNGYVISFIVDDTIISNTRFNKGGISDIRRNSNFIGKSNTTTEGYFRGLLTAFKLTVYASSSGISLYRSALYEFDTTSTDFGRPMYIELRTKAINMKYPQHLKKLKHIFVKAIGGYTYGELFFTLYGDGYIVNDPEIYDYYIDEATGTVVQEYKEVKDLTIDERVSLLGNMRLDYTKLGQGVYQTRKLIIPEKAKNFAIFTYGESSDYLSIESFGFVCKLGKVKEG